LYLLQYPNRPHKFPYSEEHDCKPSELRIKPKSGFIEVDVPMNVNASFDKRKSVIWGQARRRIGDECNGQVDFGIASGFSSRVLMARGPRGAGTGAGARRDGSAGAGARSGRGQEQEDDDEDEEVEGDEKVDRMVHDFQNSNQKGYVMNTQTLGGQVQHADKGDCFYMMGAFRGGEPLVFHILLVSYNTIRVANQPS
jgi:DNA-directed RNA polymerase III subunit RPC5